MHKKKFSRIKKQKKIKKPLFMNAERSQKLDFVRDAAVFSVGRNAVLFVELLFGKQNVNEFFISDNLKMTINQVRNVLYKLSDKGLVSFTRKKDKKKGWYTYFWTLNEEKSFFFLRKIIEKEIENLEHQIKSREMKQFYVCKQCNFEIAEENALLHNFTCQECGEIYEISNNKSAVSEMGSTLNKLKKRREDINKEIARIEEEKIKRQERKKERTKKEKLKKRREAMKNRAKLKKKIKKKKR